MLGPGSLGEKCFAMDSSNSSVQCTVLSTTRCSRSGIALSDPKSLVSRSDSAMTQVCALSVCLEPLGEVNNKMDGRLLS